MIDHLADADGHIIEPGDLWAERLPNDLRPLGPRFYRDAEGVFHSRIYGIEIDTLPVMHGGISPKDMLDNMGLSCAMGMALERVFTGAEREKHTILDAPRWAMDGRERLAFNTEHGVSRAILYPTFMLAGDRRHGREARPPSPPHVGPGRDVEGLQAARHHGRVLPRLPHGHDAHALRHDGGRGVRSLPDHTHHDPRGRRRVAPVDARAL